MVTFPDVFIILSSGVFDPNGDTLLFVFVSLMHLDVRRVLLDETVKSCKYSPHQYNSFKSDFFLFVAICTQVSVANLLYLYLGWKRPAW